MTRGVRSLGRGGSGAGGRGHGCGRGVTAGSGTQSQRWVLRRIKGNPTVTLDAAAAAAADHARKAAESNSRADRKDKRAAARAVTMP